MPDRTAPVAVFGMGNVLQRDDGLGPFAVAVLEARWMFREDVEVVDLGTPGLDLLPHLAGREAVILVDTVRADGPPGTVRTWRLADLLRHAPGPRVGPHDPGLRETLGALAFHGTAPREFLLVGVVPEAVDGTIGLTPAVYAAVPAVEAAVIDELARLGRPASPRADAHAPEPWWERTATAASVGSGPAGR